VRCVTGGYIYRPYRAARHPPTQICAEKGDSLRRHPFFPNPEIRRTAPSPVISGRAVFRHCPSAERPRVSARRILATARVYRRLRRRRVASPSLRASDSLPKSGGCPYLLKAVLTTKNAVLTTHHPGTGIGARAPAPRRNSARQRTGSWRPVSSCFPPCAALARALG